MASKAFTTATMRRFGFRTVLIASGWAFAITIGFFAFVDETTPIALILIALTISGAVRSLQGTALTGLQFSDVPKEQITGASTYATVNLQVTRAVGIALAAFGLNTATALRGGNLGEPSIHDFQIVFVGTALFSIAAALRYLVLPRDAGRHVSAGRS
jgi:hypothetical protein